jgi:4-amino-4-deoxy-L-arabinose transferase-like glycosyltransferase
MNRKAILLSTVTGIVGVLWLTASLIGYAYLHKPFSAEIVMGFARSVWQMLVMLVLLSLAGGIGARLLPFDGQPSLSAAAMQAALGLGIQGFIILIIGSLLGFSAWLWSVVYVAALVLFWKPIIKWWKNWGKLREFFPPKNLAISLAALGVGLILVYNLALALAPPLNFDALTYHLALPKFYLLHDRFTYTPDNMFWGMPQQTEMLFTISMLFGGVQTASLIGWGIGVIALAGLLDYVAGRFTPTTGWVAVISLLAGWSITDSLSRGTVEWPVMLQGLAFMICLDCWQQDGERKNLTLAGVFAGLALATKYTAGILLVIGFGIVTFRSLVSARRKTLANWLVFAGTALLVFVPWLVKNTIATGSPVYPLVFPAGAMDRVRLDLLNQQGRPWGDWREVVFLPWQATVWGVQGKVGYMASIGPLLLGLGFLAGLNWRKHNSAQRSTLVNAVLICVMGFFVWGIASRLSGPLIQSRLYFAFFPAWAVLSGIGYHALTQYQGASIRFGRIALALSLIAFGFNVFQTMTTAADKGVMATLYQIQSAEDYRTRNLGLYEPAMQFVNGLSPGSRVLMLWETRSYACLPICDPDEIIDRWHHDILAYQTPEMVIQAWRAAGYTHVLYNRTGADFIQNTSPDYQSQDWEKLDILLHELTPKQEFGNAYVLYAIP